MYFCRRGRENLRELTPAHFEVKRDDTGRKYIHKTKSDKTKNHQGDKADDKSCGRMYETGTASCPVASYDKYISKRNSNCPALFQRPCDNIPRDLNASWYENKSVGKNTLGDMMANLSDIAELSQRYTNHSIRATSITLLSDAGFEARHIKTVSGHKNEASITSYCTDTSLEQKREMSSVLSKALAPSSRALEPYVSSAAPSPPALVPLVSLASHLRLQDHYLCQLPLLMSHFRTARYAPLLLWRVQQDPLSAVWLLPCLL